MGKVCGYSSQYLERNPPDVSLFFYLLPSFALKKNSDKGFWVKGWKNGRAKETIHCQVYLAFSRHLSGVGMDVG